MSPWTLGRRIQAAGRLLQGEPIAAIARSLNVHYKQVARLRDRLANPRTLRPGRQHQPPPLKPKQVAYAE